VLGKRTGWQVVAVPGLVPDEVFFEHLANRRFPAGQFIRKPGQLDYIEEPDVFHDVFGHVPMLMHPVMADYIQAYGKGGSARAEARRAPEPRASLLVHVEFGLVESPEGVRIYGSGIASSYTESVFALEHDSPNRIGFELARVMRTRYRIDDFQETYFVIRSIDELLELARIDFAPIYAAVRGQPSSSPARSCRRTASSSAAAAPTMRGSAMPFTDRTVVITGASGNLGRAVARRSPTSAQASYSWM
jgi:phenylalanine-4-hydroxylase